MAKNAIVGAAPRRLGRSGIDRIGRYQLTELLGAGGMAEAFKARTTGPSGFERTVVIKRIHPHCSDDPEFVGMFVAEARILGMLHHPNVVQVYDFGEADGILFLVLEFIDGPSISRVISQLAAAKRQLPPAIAAYLAYEVCCALDYVHTLRDADGAPLNVIHRDVTPSNLVLTSSGSVKLLDFGVAKYGTSKVQTRQRTVKGKPAYLAPETLEGKSIDARIDIFSLGVVLHEMLTLTNLFAGDDDLITIRKVMTMPIEPPSQIRPDVPPELDAVVMKALSRDLAGRYATANEMAHDLKEIVLASKLSAADVAQFIRGLLNDTANAPAAAPLPRLAPEGNLQEPPTLQWTSKGPRPAGRFRRSWLGRWLFRSRRRV